MKERIVKRNSGIELLKIIAIILIVISHVVQTLTSENQFISYNDYVLDITNATKSFQKMILIYLSHFGVLGNSLFFGVNHFSYGFSPKCFRLSPSCRHP